MCRSVVHLPWALVALLLCVASPSAAQRVAMATAAAAGPSRTVVLDMGSGATRRVSDEPADQAFFNADGSLLVWHPSGRAGWRATVVDAGVEIALPTNFVPSGVVHPRDLALFGALDGVFPAPMARLDAAGLHVFRPCGPDRHAGFFDITPDGSRVLVMCLLSATEPSSVVEIDSTTGVPTNVISLGANLLPLGIAVTSPDEFVLVSSEYASIRLEHRRRSDGQVLASRSQALTNFTFRGNMLLPNPRRPDRPGIYWCLQVSPLPSDYTCRVDALDAASVDVVSTLQANGPLHPAVSYTASGAQALVSSVAWASLVDIATAQTLASAPAPVNGFIVAAWGAEPRTPALAAPVVSGNVVSLAWTLPIESAAATGYRLEAGYAPGATAVTIDLGSGTSTAIPGVPPGRYYARIRAVNVNGVSGPSNDIVIDVP